MKNIIFIVLLLVFSSPVLACQSKSDCSGGQICCKGTLWQDSGGFGSAGKSGACMPAKECYREGGLNDLYGEDDVQCGKGAVYCTVETAKGKIRGCFPKHLCK